MQSDLETLFHAALELSQRERLELALLLVESVVDRPRGWSIHDEGLLEELARRSADLEGAVPWTRVREELGGDEALGR